MGVWYIAYGVCCPVSVCCQQSRVFAGVSRHFKIPKKQPVNVVTNNDNTTNTNTNTTTTTTTNSMMMISPLQVKSTRLIIGRPPIVASHTQSIISNSNNNTSTDTNLNSLIVSNSLRATSPHPTTLTGHKTSSSLSSSRIKVLKSNNNSNDHANDLTSLLHIQPSNANNTTVNALIPDNYSSSEDNNNMISSSVSNSIISSSSSNTSNNNTSNINNTQRYRQHKNYQKITKGLAAKLNNNNNNNMTSDTHQLSVSAVAVNASVSGSASASVSGEGSSPPTTTTTTTSTTMRTHKPTKSVATRNTMATTSDIPDVSGLIINNTSDASSSSSSLSDGGGGDDNSLQHYTPSSPSSSPCLLVKSAPRLSRIHQLKLLRTMSAEDRQHSTGSQLLRHMAQQQQQLIRPHTLYTTTNNNNNNISSNNLDFTVTNSSFI